MKKILSFMAALLIIPSLALAAGKPQKMTDEQYRDALTRQPIVLDLGDVGIDGTWTMNFKKNGLLDEKIVFVVPNSSYKGKATIDIKATWRVESAILYTHTISAKHNDTHNRQINRHLDEITFSIMQRPDVEIDLTEVFSSIKAVRSQQARSVAAVLMKQ